MYSCTFHWVSFRNHFFCCLVFIFPFILICNNDNKKCWKKCDESAMVMAIMGPEMLLRGDREKIVHVLKRKSILFERQLCRYLLVPTLPQKAATWKTKSNYKNRRKINVFFYSALDSWTMRTEEYDKSHHQTTRPTIITKNQQIYVCT